MSRADYLLRNVYEAMQLADEIDGIDDPREYQRFMQQIEQTARERFNNSIENERENKKPTRSEMIERLVEYEQEWILNRLNESQHLYDLLKEGFEGYANFSDKKLADCYDDRFGED